MPFLNNYIDISGPKTAAAAFDAAPFDPFQA
jgi:hypothetical protein